MKTTLTALLIILMSHLSSVQAENHASIESILLGVSSAYEANCSTAKNLIAEYEAKGAIAEAEMTKRESKNFCECAPAQIQKIRSSISRKELKTQISESDFLKRFKATLFDKCAAEQAKSIYADGCAERLAKNYKNSDNYCKCMSRKLAELTDTDIADTGSAAADYIPLAAEAQKKGLPLPEQPPSMKRFVAFDAGCKLE